MTTSSIKKWEEQGCQECRQAVLVGLSYPLKTLGHIGGGHFLYQCGTCGAYWEDKIRLACEISKDEAEKLLSEIEP